MSNRPSDIAKIVGAQHAWFEAGRTLPLAARLGALRRLRAAVETHQADIAAALHADLGKSEEESYLCETGLILSELRTQYRHLRRWAAPTVRDAGIANFPAGAASCPEPYGVVLIMAPWNYPFLLTLQPLAGAIAAGNCCVVKPSAYAPASAAVIRRILQEALPPGLAAVVEGGRTENAALLEERFDYIFFTGSVPVGRLVMEKAAAHLTPVTLELGGKSPCIVAADANLPLAARRIVFGKLLNCGQTCVAPDYLLVDRRVKDKLLALLRTEAARQYGPDPFANPAYGHIVNQKHFDRLCRLLDPAKTVLGGQTDPAALRIAPTILDGADPGDPVMQEEIFGPILPVLTFDSLDGAIRFVQARPKPLALYLFTRSRAAARRVMDRTSFGGGCLNDTVMQLAAPGLPFGGVGQSGMGSYHGRQSFETFSHRKSILWKGATEVPLRYQPYGGRLRQRLVRLCLR